MHMPPVSIFWFRRDLRLSDNAGLYHALRSGHNVVPVFIFDTGILTQLDDKADKRVHFIHSALQGMQQQLAAMGSTLHVLHGTPLACFAQLQAHYSVKAVYANHDYEPAAIARDSAIGDMLREKGIPFYTFKDQVIFEKSEVVKDNKEPYTVYTPYSRKWKERLTDSDLKPYPTEQHYANLLPQPLRELPSLEQIGFLPAPPDTVPAQLNEDIARHYNQTRDIPGIEGTTRMGVHLRFGTVSVRTLAAQALALNATLLNELIWREFYQAILWHFPHVVTGAFKREYDRIAWRNNEQEFALWCQGQTGCPIVDAGMRQLSETGYMHNRVRMITASYLTKDLLIDWRWGEAWFAAKLLDYDLAANNGGWQWAAGTGCDAAPYFRVFNPQLQTQKFDPELKYIRRWVPEYDQLTYARPIVDHAYARDRCLKTYKAALNK